ncbi:ROK family protein [Aerococcus kribbianus]|uniref:fructokinase n=1 Tax=Aerococcus kribbianus TaxID=2999064 RepID=A0A9X3JFA8_9LACT|nr:MULTISPECIES: ROK family protein [unclassified Aerococcus]MCZ0716887.1 ROK family protein [Aerococcus sp. YH-aer221]MCZ0725175.1 ROK family protein [Aerococcus sp. YH-aer222]
MLAGIEAGGTKFNCIVSDHDLNILGQSQFPTTTPEETMANVFEFFSNYDIEAIGIGSFGPIDVNVDSPTYGYITNTPKIAWQNFAFLDTVKAQYNVPIFWTTDVNASAVGEYELGVAQDQASCLYLTFGTGVGGGFVKDGKIHTGMSHLEMGHIYVKRHTDDHYAGHCPFHNDCLEGLVCGPAIEDRFPKGTKAKDIPQTDLIWDVVADYIAQALNNYMLTLMPNRIIIGGGVLHQDSLLERIQIKFQELVNDYVAALPEATEYIQKPGLGDDAGLLGCLCLAKASLENY